VMGLGEGRFVWKMVDVLGGRSGRGLRSEVCLGCRESMMPDVDFMSATVTTKQDVDGPESG
jgi:hypothetical protein